jgi:tetratricopeptide (TPR) repeat protein
MAITTLPAGAFGIIDAALADRLAELLTDVSLFPIFKLTEFKFDLHKFWQILERSSPGRKYARPAKAYYTALKRFQDENQDISPTEFSKLCHDIGAFLASTDRYHGADVFFDQALAIDKREKGATHPDIELLTTLKANLLYKQGRYQEALPLYEDSLKIIEKNAALLDATRGPVLRIALANLLKEQGQVEDALALYSKSMQKQKATLGDSHPVVAVSMTNMADMYLRLDGAESLAKAVKLYEGALKIMETHKGKTHPVVGSIVASMGSVYDRLSQYGTAMAYFERALKIKETAFGRDHVGNCVVLNNMATTMVNQGRYKDALALYKRSLDIREKTQGIDHPHVAPTLANIARLYSSMADARIAAAEQRKLRESAGTGSAAGDGDGDGSRSDDHELDASTAAIGLDSQPDGAGSTPGADDAEVVQYIAAAVTSFKRAVSIIDTAFGPTHISLVDVLDDLAKAHSRADMHMEALADYQRMIQIYSQQQRLQESSAESATPAKPDKAGKAAAGKPPVGGKAGKGSKGATAPSGGDAPMSGLSVEIAGVLGKQAQVYASGLGNVHKAIECITTQCEILEALQGSDSTELADALFVLSSMYLDVERELDSLRCIRRCYSIRVAHPKLGLEHNDTLEAKTWLYDIAVVDQDACPFDEFDPATFDFDNCHVNVVATMPLSESDNSPEASRSRPQAAASGIKTGGSARNTALSGAAASAAGTKSKARSGMKALLTDED